MVAIESVNEETLSPKEEAAYFELKRRISPYLDPELQDDASLYLRFLRARDFRVDASETMLRNHITWRSALQIDSILTSYVPDEVVVKYIPVSKIGLDNEDAPVHYFEFGDFDSKGLLKCAKVSTCIKTLIQYFERDIDEMSKLSKKLGKPIDQWTFIFDFENYSFAKATHKPSLESIMQLFLTYEANYPERLKAAYFINTSIYFSLIFAVMKPVLSARTLRKVHVFGKNGWKEEFQRIMDPNILPAFLGGQRTDSDGDPMCSSWVKRAQMVPSEFYLNNREGCAKLKGVDGVRHLVVGRGSKTTMEVSNCKEGDTLEWEFETESHDIRFGLLFRPRENSTNEELVPRQRIDTQLASETGMFKCKKTGTYVLMFDNSYSWIRQKEIYCKLSVVKESRAIQVS